MVNSFCKAEDYRQISNNGGYTSIVRFSKEKIMYPVVEGEEGNSYESGDYIDSGLVKFTEETIVGEITADKVVAVRIKEVETYDASDAVNSLIVNGKPMWFDKVTRTCIAYSIRTEKANGATTTELYDNEGNSYELPIDSAIAMFDALELYAKACYNTTAAHKVALAQIDNVEDALNYNIKTGYPEKLSFNI